MATYRTEPTSFDRFADRTSTLASRATFFIICLALCVIWLPSWFLIRDVATWQLIMVTVTNVATFLMVALLQNAQWRHQAAVNAKLDAIARALAVSADAGHDGVPPELTEELTATVGLEKRVSP